VRQTIIHFIIENFLINGFYIPVEQDAISRTKRSSTVDSQQKATLTASEVQVIIRKELGLLQDQVCAKDRKLPIGTER